MYFAFHDPVEYDSADGTTVKGTIGSQEIFTVGNGGQSLYVVRTEPNGEPKHVLASLLRKREVKVERPRPDPKAPRQKCIKAFKKLINILAADGWLPTEVDDGWDEVELTPTYAKLVEAVFGVDEALAYFEHVESGKTGAIRFIWDYDMNPEEMTQDYTVNLDDSIVKWSKLYE